MYFDFYATEIEHLFQWMKDHNRIVTAYLSLFGALKYFYFDSIIHNG